MTSGAGTAACRPSRLRQAAGCGCRGVSDAFPAGDQVDDDCEGACVRRNGAELDRFIGAVIVPDAGIVTADVRRKKSPAAVEALPVT